MRRILPLLALTVALAAPVAANADPISIGFFSEETDQGFTGGTGILDLSGTGTPSGTYAFGSGILDFSFMIDGAMFNPGNSLVEPTGRPFECVLCASTS